MAGAEDAAAAGLHVAGLGIAAVLGRDLWRLAARGGMDGDRRRVVVAFILAWIILYAASVAFHLAPEGGTRRLLSVLDNAAIFVVVAAGWAPLGPFKLPLRQSRRLLVLLTASLVAGIAVEAAALAAGRRDRFQDVAYVLYGIQGIVPAVLLGRVIATRLSHASVAYLLGSIAAYALGFVFYRNPELPWNHAVWHGFVVVGCLLNFGGVRELLLEAPGNHSRDADAVVGGGGMG